MNMPRNSANDRRHCGNRSRHSRNNGPPLRSLRFGRRGKKPNEINKTRNRCAPQKTASATASSLRQKISQKSRRATSKLLRGNSRKQHATTEHRCGCCTTRATMATAPIETQKAVAPLPRARAASYSEQADASWLRFAEASLRRLAQPEKKGTSPLKGRNVPICPIAQPLHGRQGKRPRSPTRASSPANKNFAANLGRHRAPLLLAVAVRRLFQRRQKFGEAAPFSTASVAIRVATARNGARRKTKL